MYLKKSTLLSIILVASQTFLIADLADREPSVQSEQITDLTALDFAVLPADLKRHIADIELYVSKEHTPTRALQDFIAAVAQDYELMPKQEVEQAVTEIISLLQRLYANDVAVNRELVSDFLSYQELLVTNDPEIVVSLEEMTRSKKEKVYCSLIVEKCLQAGNLIVKHDADVYGTLTAQQLLILSNASIQGALSVGAGLSIQGPLTVTGPIISQGGEVLTGNVTLNGSLTTTGNITTAGEFIGESAEISGNITAGGNITGVDITATGNFLASDNSYTFTSDLGSGMHHPALSTLTFTTAGTTRLKIDPNGTVEINDGTGTGSALEVTGNTSATAETIAAGNGQTALSVTASANPITSPAVQIIQSGAADALRITGNVTVIGNIAATGSITDETSDFFATNGTESSPSYTFTTNQNTGLYLPAPDTLGITAGGLERIVAGPTGTFINTGASALYTAQTTIGTTTFGGKVAINSADANSGTTPAFSVDIPNGTMGISSAANTPTVLIANSGTGTDSIGLEITGNTFASAAVFAGNGTVVAPALTLIGNPPSSLTDDILTIDPVTGVVKQTSAAFASGFILNGGQAGAPTSGLLIGTTDAFPLTFETNGTAVLAITSGGAVSIAAPTSGTALAVNGNATSTAETITAGTNQTALAVIGNGTATAETIVAGSGIGLSVASSTGGAAISATGNSTTTAPALKLVNNPTSAISDFILTTDATGAVKQGATALSSQFILNGGQAGAPTAGLLIGTTDAFPLNFETTGTTRVTVNSGGGVIINPPSTGNTNNALAVTGSSGATAATIAAGTNEAALTIVGNGTQPAVTMTTAGTAPTLELTNTGTTAVSNALTVTGSTAATAATIAAGTGQTALAVTGSGATAQTITPGANQTGLAVGASGSAGRCYICKYWIRNNGYCCKFRNGSIISSY